MIELAYVGHATTLIGLGGATVLTDPVLRSRIGPLRRHGPPADPAALDADVVVISHQHRDHLDLPSLARLRPNTPVVAPKAAGPLIERAGIERVTGLSPGESARVAGLEITATEAVHDGRRDAWGRAAGAIGVLLEGGSERVYFPGDTDLFEGMALLGPLDLALVPVWGWGPNLGSGHLDPAEAARALKLLRPRVAVPIHWGTFYPVGLSVFRPRPLSEPPRRFAELAAREAPDVDVRVLEPGERTTMAAMIRGMPRPGAV